MLKGLTSTFKNGCNNVEVMYREYLVLGNQTIPIKAELSDDSYENGNFIGTFIFKTIKFETDAQYDFKNKEFEYYKEVNGESVKIGTFITTEVEINDTTEIVKVVGMDYGLKTQIAYRSQLDYSAGNITLLDVWNEACQLSGLESGIDYFPNGDFIVDNDQFTGTGATIRDVFKGIAMSSGSFVKVMNDDKIYLVFNSYTGDTETATISGSGSVNDGYAIDNFQVEGKAEQHSYSGKNLFNINGNVNINGRDGTQTTFNSVSDGILTTESNTAKNHAIGQKYTDLNGKTITFSADVVSVGTSSANPPRVRIAIYDNGTMATRAEGVVGDRLTITYTCTSDNIVCGFTTANGTGGQFTNIQVEISNSETSYEPFTNNLPTPNPYYPEEIKTVSGIGNLFDINATPIFNVSNNTIATPIENGVRVTIKNNSSGNYSVVYKLIDVSNYVGKKFTIKMDFVSSVSNKARYMIGLCDENGENRKASTAIDISGTSYTYTIPTITTSKYLCVWLYSNKSGTATAGDYVDYTNIQVQMSDTIHTPVPYGHWLPVKVSNKNLLNLDTTSYGYINDSGNVAGTGSHVNRLTDYIRFDENMTVSLSTTIYGIGYALFDENKNYLSRVGRVADISNYTINSNSAKYVRIWFSYDSSSDTTIELLSNLKAMIEEGTTATEYIEHQEQTTLIDLNKYDENNNIVGNYEICTTLTAPADNLDVLTIKDGRAILTKRMGKYVADSNSPFYKTQDIDGLYHLSAKGTPTIPYVGYRGISNCFINNPDTRITANVQANQYLSDGQFAFRWAGKVADRERIYFKYLAIPNDVTAFKQLMVDNNLTLYYRQNAETIILRGTYDINLYEGVNYISIEDELEPTMVMSYYKDNLDIIEDYVELEDKRDTRPWTCLRLGMSQVEGENVDYIDEELVAKYGENWLILNDNPFAYTQQKRQQLITNIFNRIKEFGYSAFVSKTSFKPYLTAGDIVKFKNREGNLVKTILLRYNHNAEEITLESPSETSATVNYVYPLTDIDLYKKAEIQVDKANNQIMSNVENIALLQTSSSSNADNINALTSLVDSQGEEIERLGTRITQNVDSINASVTAIQGEIEQGVGLVKTTSVTIDDNGLSVSTDTSKIQTTMTNDTFKITDNGGTELAKFGYDENEGISIAEMDNLTVKNYFIAGVHRVETIEIDGEERTGWFYMGG